MLLSLNSTDQYVHERLALILLLGFSAFPSAAQTPNVIAPSGKWVTDTADMLSASEEGLLSQRLAGFADSTSTQIVVVTIPSLDGSAAVDYAVALGRSWGVGQQGRDNGIVVLVSRDDREVFIAPGFGLEGAVPDIVASRIVRQFVLPRFRERRFYEGLSDAVDALMLASAGEYDAIQPDEPPFDMRTVALAFIILVILVIVISSARQGGSGGSGGTRYRSRSGPVIIWGNPGFGHRHGGFGTGGFGGGGFGGGGFGGFGGGGGSFGGGGAGGSW